MSDDPRLGLPSASSFSLDALCPGRQQLLDEIGDIPEPVDEDAERGTRLHAAWEKEDLSGLDSEDAEIYNRGLKLVEETKAQWLQMIRATGASFELTEGKREERFWYHYKGELAASGQADRHYTAKPGHALVIDFKSLWAKSLAPAELNWQARLLSVLVAREYGVSHVRFAFLKAMLKKSDIVDYSAEDLERAQYSIQQTLWESKQEGAPRRSGAHCRHCKAASACPEAASWTMLPTTQLGANGGGITPKLAEELVENVSLLDCAKVWSGITSRHNIEDAIKTRLKALPEPTLAELGLMFGKAKTLRSITHTERAFEFLLSVGVPIDKLWSVTKMSNGELAALVQTALGLSSEKAAKAWINEKLASCIIEKQAERPLEKF